MAVEVEVEPLLADRSAREHEWPEWRVECFSDAVNALDRLLVLTATGAKPDAGPIIKAQAALGQAPLTAPSPAGWPDDAASWATPEAMMRRVEFALAFAEKAKVKMEPGDLAESVLGDALSDETGTAIRRAGSRTEALALLLASPEFQRR